MNYICCIALFILKISYQNLHSVAQKMGKNGRKHVAHVNGPFIQLAGQRSPVYMDNILFQEDEWEELNEKNAIK